MSHHCKYCKYDTDRLNSYKRHLETNKHKYNKIKYEENNQITEEKIKTLITNAIDKSKMTELAKDTNLQVKNALRTSKSLIKYLMLNHSNAPALEQMSSAQSKQILYKDYNVNESDNNYTLHMKLLKDYKNKTIIDKIKTSILNNIQKKEHTEQSIYNTDLTRLNYIIKTNLYNWIEDKSGIHFDKLVIKPILDTIINLMKEYREYITTKKGKIEDKMKELEEVKFLKEIGKYKEDDKNINQELDDINKINNKLNDMNEENTEITESDMIMYYTEVFNKICEDIYECNHMISDLQLNKLNNIILKHIGPYLRMLIKNKDSELKDKNLDLIKETDSDIDISDDMSEDEIELEINELREKIEKLEQIKNKKIKSN
jgi:hypothetical protein